jgi:general secretion pathway protein I
LKAGAKKLNAVRTRGFTLLEVLVALAVLALSAAAVLRQTQLGVQQQQRLELKTYAMWIADDELAGIIAAPNWPPVGRSAHRINVREMEWEVTTDVQATTDPDLRKILVSVNLAQAPADTALVAFTAYRGHY